MNKKSKHKMFIVRKYIKATSAADAIKKEKNTPVHDVWVDEDWKKNHLADAIGFIIDNNEDDFEEE